MKHRTYVRLSVALLLTSSACDRLFRDEPRRAPASSPSVTPGPNALGPDGRPRGSQGATTGTVVEGRHKPPPSKPGDDRFQVRPEWYPTGAPQNPYPPGTVIPVEPPGQGVSIRPIPAGPAQPPAVPTGNGAPLVTLTPMGPPTDGPYQNPARPSPSPSPTGQGVTLTPMGEPSAPQPTAPPTLPSQPSPQPAGDATAQTFQGTLDQSAQRDPEGRFFRSHTVNLRRGQRVAVTLQSAAFDTLLRVEPPAGEPMENDDIGNGDLNSRLDFTAAVDGAYSLVATSYGPNMTGAYTLQAQGGAPGDGLVVVNGPGPQPGPQTGQGGTLTAGAPVNEYLSPGDPSSGGRYVRAYRLDGRRGDLVSLRLESRSFDTTLALIAPNGQRWSNDDINPQDTNSALQVTLPAAGAYRVEVSSYRVGATGPFTLSMTNSARPTGAPGAAPSGNVAGRRAAGNMYGVFVGITDYGGRGNLFGCADDARQLAQAYINARLGGAGNFVVLTDAEATTERVQQAFQQMAARVGPEDVFMFFHSGHGNRRASTDRVNDPDGFVETIVLRDGEITGTQMAQMFNGLRADVNMLALDSCYSGGFQRAFASAPNRYGMYSSEEDVLSQVAQRYQAGGYLSYFLRRGVSEADTNRDGAVRAGELADYLHRQFAQNQAQMRTSDGQDVDTWQNLVINRSGVALADNLWRFPQLAGAESRLR